MNIRARIILLALSLSALAASVAFGAEGKPLATCNDGATMYSTTGKHTGACQGHHGVKAWLDGSPAPKGHAKTTSYTGGAK